jgi:hypothetical protein
MANHSDLSHALHAARCGSTLTGTPTEANHPSREIIQSGMPMVTIPEAIQDAGVNRKNMF